MFLDDDIKGFWFYDLPIGEHPELGSWYRAGSSTRHEVYRRLEELILFAELCESNIAGIAATGWEPKASGRTRVRFSATVGRSKESENEINHSRSKQNGLHTEWFLIKDWDYRYPRRHLDDEFIMMEHMHRDGIVVYDKHLRSASVPGTVGGKGKFADRVEQAEIDVEELLNRYEEYGLMRYIGQYQKRRNIRMSVNQALWTEFREEVPWVSTP